MDGNRLLAVLNNSGLSENLSQLKAAVVMNAARMLDRTFAGKQERSERDEIKRMLQHVGPAAATSAVEFALNVCKKNGDYQGVKFNGSLSNNLNLVFNDNEACVGAFPNFTNVLRQFLLPRYAYLDFDQVVDPRHQIDVECGYPKFITPIMYRYMYDRDDMARRVVDFYPDETWASNPIVSDTEKEEEMTPFKEDLQRLVEDYNLWQYCYRIDRLGGIGHYGALLLGIDDGRDLEAPIDEPLLLAGARRPPASRPRHLLYMRPFDEYLSFIHMYETDVLHPRYGLPKFYNLVFLDMTIDAAGASIGTRLNRRVHWTRVVHVADQLQSSLVFGTPRMQPLFNRLLDLRKIKGGSAEMFWKGAFPGLSFEIDPRFVADDPDFDEQEFKRQVEEYSSGLQRYLTTLGVSVKSLATQIPDNTERYIDLQVKSIAITLGVPLRLFIGSEEARLASSQEKLTWNRRLQRKIKQFTEPNVIRNLIDRLISIGIIRPPQKGRYTIAWDDLNTPTDEDKANLALKWSQAMSQYVASGMIHFIPPRDYMTMVLGWSPADAIRIDDWMKAEGGYKKLQEVDPSKGAGMNGKQQNLIDSGSVGSRDAGPNKADRMSDGMKGK